MWLFSKSGFVSIVEHYQDPDILIVRSRVEADLAPFALEGYMIEHTPSNDYGYRMFLPRAFVVVTISTMVSKIDYFNFKNTVADKQRSKIYMRIWSVALGLQSILQPSKGINHEP